MNRFLEDFVIDNRLPITAQIIEVIETMIRDGRLAANTSLPPVREMAARLGVNFNTVARAYRNLDQRGLVITRQGRGTYVQAQQDKSRQLTQIGPSLTDRITKFQQELRNMGFQDYEIREAFRNALTTMEQ